MDKVNREDADKFALSVGGFPITFLMEFPDGTREEMGGVVVTSVRNGGLQVASALVEIALRFKQSAEEHDKKHPHHTDNPSAN